MSLGYADKLKQRKNLGGQLGWPEHHDSLPEVAQKAKDLLELLRSSPECSIFAFTGAGISTSIGIPDFRGPKGIWTLRKKNQPVPPMQARFEYAHPSFTHMSLSGLMKQGKVSYVCSQNVDSLHLRSGIPRSKLAELHGNCFAERCSLASKVHTEEFKKRQKELGLVALGDDEEGEGRGKGKGKGKGSGEVSSGNAAVAARRKVKEEGERACGHLEIVRDFEIETVGFEATGRACPHCLSPMVDNTLDWDSALPEDELEGSIEAADQAKVCLVLGTSLQISPSNELPLITHGSGGKVVIVNLQRTPRDKIAWRVVRCRVDFFMALIMKGLNLPVPRYMRRDSIVVSHCIKWDTLQEKEGERGGRLEIMISSPHGSHCPLPMVQSAKILPSLPSSFSSVLASSEGVPFVSHSGSNPKPQFGSAGPLTLSVPLSDLGIGYSMDSSSAHHRVEISVNLCTWTDPDRQSISLSYPLGPPSNLKSEEEGLIPSVMDSHGQGQSSSAAVESEWDTYLGRSNLPTRMDDGRVRDEGPFVHQNDQQQGLVADGEEGTRGAGSSGALSYGLSPRRYSFITQVRSYDPDAVISGHKASQEAEGAGPSSSKAGEGKKKVGRSKRGKKRRANDSSEEEEEEKEEEEDWEEE